jgi:hypothetical protein
MSLPKPLSLTGNPEGAEGPAVRLSPSRSYPGRTRLKSVCENWKTGGFLVGAPVCMYAGEGALQRSGKEFRHLMMRFSAGVSHTLLKPRWHASCPARTFSATSLALDRAPPGGNSIGSDHSIADVDHTMGVLGDIWFMGDQDDSVAVRV